MSSSTSRRRCRMVAAAALVAPLAVAAVAAPAQAKKGGACDGTAWTVAVAGVTVGPPTEEMDEIDRTIPAAQLPAGDDAVIQVRGTYVTFDVRLSDFAALAYGFTGAANPEDITGGVPTPVFESKVPDHRGLVLDGALAISLDDEKLELRRTGTGLAMKIQAKDCAQGGIFQMEPERADATTTRITHTLATSETPSAVTPFYFDNPFFRARAGQFLGSTCTDPATGPAGQFCVEVRPRINIGNDSSPAFVARDSAQVAERVPQPECGTVPPVDPPVEHCSTVSVWDVASGGRMGFVSGEDAVEVANPPTECVQDCQAQNQVRGRLAVLGHPFPVPVTSRLVVLPIPPLPTPPVETPPVEIPPVEIPPTPPA